MSWLKGVARETVGLFVDDGSLAVAIIVWLGLAWLAEAALHVGGTWPGVLLFAGLAAILVENAWRRARRR